MKLLQAQSTRTHKLYKNENKGLYYVVRMQDNKKSLLGDKDTSENFILYGIEANKKELQTLIFE